MSFKIPMLLNSLKGDKVIKIITDGDYTVLDKTTDNQCERLTFNDLFIIFENDYILRIYLEYSKLKVNYRLLDLEGKKKYLSDEFVDLFNDRVKHDDYLALELDLEPDDSKKYDVIVETQYDVLESVEYVDKKIIIKLVNGIEFYICCSEKDEKQISIKCIGCNISKV